MRIIHKVPLHVCARGLWQTWHSSGGPGRNWLKLTTFVLLVLVLLHGPGVAQAHTDGKIQLAAADAGDFKVTVWTSPDPASVEDELHVAVAVTLVADASPVLNADVQVQLTPDSGGQAISAQALSENSENKFLYEAVVSLQEAGDYTVAVRVVDADGLTGEALFNMAVEGSSTSNLVLIVVVIVVLIGVSATILLVRRARDSD